MLMKKTISEIGNCIEKVSTMEIVCDFCDYTMGDGINDTGHLLVSPHNPQTEFN